MEILIAIIKTTGWLIVMGCLAYHRKNLPINIFYTGLMSTSLLVYAAFEEFVTDGLWVDDQIMWIVADVSLIVFIVMCIRSFSRQTDGWRRIKGDIERKRREMK